MCKECCGGGLEWEGRTTDIFQLLPALAGYHINRWFAAKALVGGCRAVDGGGVMLTPPNLL
jgi:hypothetical protein